MNKKADIILCVYNGADYLRAAIDSLLADPDLPPADILCFDDGSTDRTPDIAAAFAPKIRYFRASHRGIAASRNHALSMTKNEFVAFFDADDIWLPGGLTTRINRIENADKETGICFGGFQELLQDKERTGSFSPGREILHAVCPGTALTRRTVFNQVGGFNESLSTAYFMDWFSRVQTAGLKACFAEVPVIQRRIHDTNSGIMEKDRFKKEHMQVLREHLKRKRNTNESA